MRMVALCMLSLGLFLAACGPEPTNSVPQVLRLVQDKNSVSASLTATMTFDDHGTKVTLPTECSVKDVPIMWSGNVFYGSVYEDADERVISAVRGTISPDGSWIDTLKFSRQASGKSPTGLEFEITLRYLTIADPGSIDVATVGQFEKVSDVRKHIASFECSQGEAKQVSTEWAGADNATSPRLRVSLHRLIVQREQAPAQPGCFCEW